MPLHRYDPCQHVGRHGYGDSSFNMCEVCRRGPGAPHLQTTREDCLICAIPLGNGWSLWHCGECAGCDWYHCTCPVNPNTGYRVRPWYNSDPLPIEAQLEGWPE